MEKKKKKSDNQETLLLLLHSSFSLLLYVSSSSGGGGGDGSKSYSHRLSGQPPGCVLRHLLLSVHEQLPPSPRVLQPGPEHLPCSSEESPILSPVLQLRHALLSQSASKLVLELIVLLIVEAFAALVHQPAHLNFQQLTAAVVVCYGSFLTALDDAGWSVFRRTQRWPLPSVHAIVVKKFCHLHAAALQPAIGEPVGQFSASQSCPTLQLAELLRGRPPRLSKIVLEERQGSAVWRH